MSNKPTFSQPSRGFGFQQPAPVKKKNKIATPLVMIFLALGAIGAFVYFFVLAPKTSSWTTANISLTREIDDPADVPEKVTKEISDPEVFVNGNGLSSAFTLTMNGAPIAERKKDIKQWSRRTEEGTGEARKDIVFPALKEIEGNLEWWRKGQPFERLVIIPIDRTDGNRFGLYDQFPRVFEDYGLERRLKDGNTAKVRVMDITNTSWAQNQKVLQLSPGQNAAQLITDAARTFVHPSDGPLPQSQVGASICTAILSCEGKPCDIVIISDGEEYRPGQNLDSRINPSDNAAEEKLFNELIPANLQPASYAGVKIVWYPVRKDGAARDQMLKWINFWKRRFESRRIYKFDLKPTL